MIKIEEVIIVEGKYDKIRLESLLDTTIIEVGGFHVFKDKKYIALIKKLAEKRGAVIFTDSDKAGFKIRNYIKGNMRDTNLKHAYIPDIKGKEKRKKTPSKEGNLGLEGMSDEIIINALLNCGVKINGEIRQKRHDITKLDLYDDGLVGRENSFSKRQKFLNELNLPKNLSTNALIDVLNIVITYEEYKSLVKNIL